MADTLLIDLFKNVGSIVVQLAKEEINLLVGVDEVVQKLQDKLGFIRAMVDDAEERHAVKQRTEKLWLEQIQNQYYELEDILDKWNTARIRAKIEKEEGKPAETNAPADTNALAVFKKKVSSILPSPSRFFNLPQRHEIGRMIVKLTKKLDRIVKEKACYGIDFNRQPDVVERSTTTSFVDVSNIIGRDKYRDDPLRNLLDVGSLEGTNSYRVISLVGMGGIGKTSLAQLAYNHSDVRAHFHKRMWVCVSDPFDQCNVAKAIIYEVDRNHGSLNDANLQTLLGKIQDLIEDKKFFLVLDDVWTEDSQKWEPFKFALKNCIHGSRILVTTRKQNVAKMMESAPTINLDVLSEENCWLIFRKIAFSNEDQLTDLKDIGKNLASRCRGLPLAAKTLGSLMQNKRSREQWNSILGSHLWELEDIEKGLLAPFFLSYYELPSTMRRCFSFCAVFPKDSIFSREQLVFHWMAQGYVESKASMEMEVIAEEYFEKLAMLSFFQDFKKDSNGEVISCKMHDIVHDFAKFMAKNESFEIDGDKKLEIECRHLHLKLSKEMQCLKSINHAEKLRTLFLLSHERGYEFKMLLSNSFDHLKCLRTLILDCPIKKLPDAVENLIHLRWLFISENVGIEKLPETLCNLCNLQALNIEESPCFTKLPQGMSKLINLRHLIVDNHPATVVFPKGIGKLTELRTLSQINLGRKDDREGCKLEELKNLNQLRGTLRINGLENVVDVSEVQNAQLKKKTHLRCLELYFNPIPLDEDCYVKEVEHDLLVLNAFEPPPHLQDIEIRSYVGSIFNCNWMMSLTTLKTLQFHYCPDLVHLPSFGQLPFLEVLDMWALYNVKKVGDEFLGIEDSKNKKECDLIFPNLKSLKINMMSEWEEWVGVEGTGEGEEENDNGIVTTPIKTKIMPRLQSLDVSLCRKLKSLPDYVLAAPLKELVLSSSTLLEEFFQIGTGHNWLRISHIPNIKLHGKYVQRDGKPQNQFTDNSQNSVMTVKFLTEMEIFGG